MLKELPISREEHTNAIIKYARKWGTLLKTHGHFVPTKEELADCGFQSLGTFDDKLTAVRHLRNSIGEVIITLWIFDGRSRSQLDLKEQTLTDILKLFEVETSDMIGF
jgi:hypothetical protein